MAELHRLANFLLTNTGGGRKKNGGRITNSIREGIIHSKNN
jgi:hypothetical protein